MIPCNNILIKISTCHLEELNLSEEDKDIPLNHLS
jgi:hypothetical protein